MDGWDFLMIGGVLALAIFGFYRYAVEAVEREWQRDWEYRQRRARFAAELDEVPVDWLDDLAELRGLPEVAA